MDFARQGGHGQSLTESNVSERGALSTNRATERTTVGSKGWSEKFGNVTVTFTRFGGGAGPTLPDIPPQAWRRGAQFIGALGVERSLYILNARAERALLAGRVITACNWRNVMAAIHAITEEDLARGEASH